MSLIALGADELKLTDAGRNRLVTDEAGNALWGRRPAGLTPGVPLIVPAGLCEHGAESPAFNPDDISA